jgi:hypothetical protein
MFSRYVIIPYHLIIDQASFKRSLRMRPYSSRVIPPTSPLCYQPWITSTNTSRLQHSIQSTPHQSNPLSLLERRPSTGTTTKQTIPKSFALQWVWFPLLFCLHLLLTFILVLHPKHKLQYFEQAGWEEAWVESAKELVQTEFERSYKYSDDVFAASSPTLVRE